MTPEEYRRRPGINYSLLADFNESQDHALIKREPQSYFEFGHEFEILLQDMAKDTKKLYDRFFLANASGEMPPGIAKWVENKEDLTEKYVYTQKGERSKTYKRLHEWLDECLKHPGLMPVSQQEMDQLCWMAENVMNAEANIQGNKIKVADLLTYGEWQKPIFWDEDGIKKKCLHDIKLEASDYVYQADIKAYASHAKFVKECKQKIWIQDIHYSHGAQAEHGKTAAPMLFIVASKEDPFLCKTLSIDPESRPYLNERYIDLCRRCNDWIEGGKAQKGWIETETLKVY